MLMKKQTSAGTVCFVLVLFIFAAFMAWYDRAVEELPRVQEELKEKAPLAEEAEEKVAGLKARRKELRAEKEELEKQLSPADSSKEADADE